MPQNQFQKMIYALITVIVTVCAFVFYNIYVVNGHGLSDIADGVYMLGRTVPIWLVLIVEFCFAYTLEILVGSPCSFKMASNMFDPRTTNPTLFETAIIFSTVAIMCPAMSFIASFLYYPWGAGFSVLTLIANWFKLVCLNLPFALLSQLFFIQPFVRSTFNLLFRQTTEA